MVGFMIVVQGTPSLVGLIKAFDKHWDAGYVEEENIEDRHSFHAICDEEPLEDQTSSSSHELLVHDISDLEEDKDNKVTEDSIVAPHEEDIYDESTQASISSSLEEKCLVSHLPLQIFDFNDVNFDDMERADFVEEHIEDEKSSHVLIPPCEEEDN